MPRKKKNPYVPYIAIGVVLVAFVLAWGPIRGHYFKPQPPVTPPVIVVQIDPLCQYVENLQMRCLVSPAAEGLMGPGHYVKYSPDAAAHTKVPFSNGDLFDPVCVVPGVKAADMIAALLAQLQSQEKTNIVPFDEITFRLDRTFQAGVDIPIPKLSDLRIKAGPKATEVQDISIKAPNAWVKVVDENRFLDLLAEAAIKQSCIDDLIEQKYSVVSKAAIAQNYDIVVKEKSGQSFALSAAIQKGDLQMNGGGDANANLDEVIKKASATPVVVGVDFFSPAILSKNRAKLVSPVFSATAETRTRAKALGQGGTLWQVERVAQLGQHVPLQQQGGGGGGSCGRPSTIQLTSVVAPSQGSPETPGSRKFDFITSGEIAGGLTGRAQTGPFGVTTCVPTPEIVEAEVSFNSSVKITVRSDSATTLQLALTGIPSSDARVVDWQGRELPRTTPENGQGTGLLNFKLNGAGVYELRLSGSQTFRAAGGATPVNQSGTFTATIQ